MLRALTSLRARSLVSVTCAHRERVISAVFTTRPRPRTSFALQPSSIYPRRPLGTTPSDTADEKQFQEYLGYLDSLSPAQKKFLDALFEYHARDFSNQTPTRFFKMIVKAVDSNQDGVITMEEYQVLLKNIGAHEKMTDQDMHDIFVELGDGVLGEEKVITVESIENRWAPFLHVMWKK
mmetsp:Transcript_5859/g.14672  ORF Transcript_5859/g.14672 Transcript_5859/m.14672 type:complete len:179 (+) Transcript_5859:62-598(+)|eukprot:CAMPEP_0181088214 /NCGR_PEP_ID=MMETSP1071-20121207/6668_1 /TAXON_ID=35127 /ORGANISM="Thalassiosira sp., Strain NH16" /LENGTH=178 /DNA_ID=CAMNT_0023170117 /DNA_START=58 /DNA_END=594 /DNA_ORIENTATION=-